MTDAEKKVAFNFKELKPDQSNFVSRSLYFFKVTNPAKFAYSNQQIREGCDVVLKYQQLAKKSPDGTIYVTPEERERIVAGNDKMISCANDLGEIVFKPFRMCAFMWMKIPINCGMVLAPPTVFWTVLVQFVS